MSIKLTEAERVGDLIKKTGKTLTQVAAESGISQNRLSDWANDKLKDGVRTSTLKKACDYFQCSADYILGYSDVPRRDPDLDMIQKYTGLSERSISYLHDWLLSIDVESVAPAYKNRAATITETPLVFINNLIESGALQNIINLAIKAKIRASESIDLFSDEELYAAMVGYEYKCSQIFSAFLSEFFKNLG